MSFSDPQLRRRCQPGDEKQTRPGNGKQASCAHGFSKICELETRIDTNGETSVTELAEDGTVAVLQSISLRHKLAGMYGLIEGIICAVVVPVGFGRPHLHA